MRIHSSQQLKWSAQLRNLRQTIPSLMQIMHVEHPSPEAFYIEISQTAAESFARIQRFTSLVQDSRGQSIFARAIESRTKNEEGVTGWLVTQHPDWLDRAVEDGVKKLNLAEDQTNDGSRRNFSSEDVTSALDSFRETHPLVEVLVENEAKSIKVYMLIDYHVLL